MGASGARDSEAYSLVLAKINFLTRKTEGLSISTSTSNSAHMTQSPQICDTWGANHLSSTCPLIGYGFASIEQGAYAYNFQCQGNI